MIKTIQELKIIIEKLISENESIIISPHINPDVDALASSLALYMIVHKMGKEAHIVIDDENTKLDTSITNIMDDLPSFISLVRPMEVPTIIEGKKALLITVDTNKSNMIPLNDLSMFSDIAIIDHHDIGQMTIPTDYKYINTNTSSVSEVLANFMRLFGIKIIGRNAKKKPEEDYIPLSDYLLSGIVLDTDNFRKSNVGPKTMKTVSKLLTSGASMEFVTDLFRSESTSAIKVHGLVSKTDIDVYNLAIAMNKDDPYLIYTTVELAKAADYLIQLKGMDAAFVLGYIKEGLVGISARSKGRVPVGDIMSVFGGGGNNYQAASKVETNDIKALKLEIEHVASPGYKLK